MARTVLDIPTELLDEAAQVLGTKGKAETVRAALRAQVAQARRREFSEAIKRGEFDFGEIIGSTGPKDADGSVANAPGSSVGGSPGHAA